MRYATVGAQRLLEWLRSDLPRRSAQASLLRQRTTAATTELRRQLAPFAGRVRLLPQSDALPSDKAGRRIGRGMPSRYGAHRATPLDHVLRFRSFRGLGRLLASLGDAVSAIHLNGGSERILPITVAAIVLVATVISVAPVPAANQDVGAVSGSGNQPRLALALHDGSDARSLAGLSDSSGAATDQGGSPDEGTVSSLGFVDPGVSSDTPGAAPDDPSAANLRILALGPEPDQAAQPSGQFLEDGTLLKPVAVDTSVQDSKDRLRSYAVRSGDTLTGIASRFGISMMTLWWANHLNSKDELHLGQNLVIPPVNGLVVVVKDGDTLNAIAARTHVPAGKILTFNQLTDRTVIIGQTLIVPGAVGAGIKEAPAPKPAPAAHASSSGHTGAVSRPPVHFSGGSFAWPVPGGYISQYYHASHRAIDIAAPYGSRIQAAAAGTVIYAGWKSNGGGYQVWIAHGDGLYTAYYHMSAVLVGVGEHVGRGDQIGRIGMTGWATGPHCHFEVWHGVPWQGYQVNPLNFY